MGINPEQQRAVETTEGRVLVLAGAGTGKTLVLTTRIAYLIQEKGVSPEAILGLTFTNKAAEEMRHRLAKWVPAAIAKRVALSTFHSFCMQILRQEIHHLGYTEDFTLYNEGDIERLVKMIVRDLLERDGELPSLAPTMRALHLARSKGISPDEIEDPASSWHDDLLKKLYRRLLEAMRAHNALDFDHLLYLTAELFEKHPAVLAKYQERYRYILIDEYQDTNPIQYKIASLLAQKYQNLCVVGDDDQSIYGWRGADVQNILNFDQAAVIKLEQNYRSTPTILNAANSLILQNRSRHGKSLWSSQEAGEKIQVFVAPTEKEEAEAIAYKALKMREKYQLRWSDIAILYRSNSLSRQLEQALLKVSWFENGEYRRGIPYHIFGGVEFYERREVKDVMAYLRVLVNPSDEAALVRIINLPRRGIGESTLDALTQINRGKNIPLWDLFQQAALDPEIPIKARNGFASFFSLMKEAKHRFASPPFSPSLEWLIESADLKRAIKEDVQSEKMREFKWENVQEMISSLAEYESLSPSPSLLDYLQKTPLQGGDRPFAKASQEEGIQLMTFHSAKGLEFPLCFLAGLEDHIIPHEKSLKETGLEEERRLLYVALTRAKKHLVLSMAKQRLKMGKAADCRPSRFLHEIPKDLLLLTRWDEVT